MPIVLNKRTALRSQLKNSTYVGRPTEWGNDFIIGEHGDRREVVQKYRAHLNERLAADPTLRDRIKRELGGKNLVCWCAPMRCHADVLLEIANG
jgi:hypothetical protein